MRKKILPKIRGKCLSRHPKQPKKIFNSHFPISKSAARLLWSECLPKARVGKPAQLWLLLVGIWEGTGGQQIYMTLCLSNKHIMNLLKKHKQGGKCSLKGVCMEKTDADQRNRIERTKIGAYTGPVVSISRDVRGSRRCSGKMGLSQASKPRTHSWQLHPQWIEAYLRTLQLINPYKKT